MSKIQLSKNFIRNTCKLALAEDLYPSGDITSNLLNNNSQNILPGKTDDNDSYHNYSKVVEIASIHLGKVGGDGYSDQYNS